MPRYVRPTFETPVEAAIDAFGANPLRIGILGYLATNSPASRKAISDGIDVDSDAIKAHLRALEHDGLISGDPAPDVRAPGQRVLWSLEARRVNELYEILGAQIGVKRRQS